MSDLAPVDEIGLHIALENARASYAEGGVPIGAVLVSSMNTVLGQGHNERVQKQSVILHAETAALENAGRRSAQEYRASTMYTTLSPCSMCTGAILLYKIPRVVIGENTNFKGDEELLRARGVEVIVADDDACKELMAKFIHDNPRLWFEDIGE